MKGRCIYKQNPCSKNGGFRYLQYIRYEAKSHVTATNQNKVANTITLQSGLESLGMESILMFQVIGDTLLKVFSRLANFRNEAGRHLGIIVNIASVRCDGHRRTPEIVIFMINPSKLTSNCAIGIQNNVHGTSM